MKTAAWIVLLMSGCLKNEGDSVMLQDMMAPSEPPACAVDANGTITRSRGIRDITLAFDQQGYVAYPRLLNQMNESEPINVNPRGNVRAEANNVTLRGFNVCYEFQQNQRAPHADDERLLDCEDLGGGTQFLRASANSAEPAGGRMVVSVDLFPPGVTTADPRFTDIPLLGEVTVIVHLQAVTITQDGRQLNSNELTFPVELCNGCLRSSCAANQQETFSGCNFGQDGSTSCVTPMAR